MLFFIHAGRPLRPSMILLSGGLVLAPCALAQTVPMRAAVLSHVDPVPGVPGAIFSLSSPPTQIDSAGRVSFRTAFTRPVGTGLWSEGSGTLRLIAIEGGPVPGVPGTVFTTFNGVNIVMSDNDRVAFRTSVNPGNLTGVWSQEGPELALAAIHGQLAPSSPAGNWELNSNLPTVSLSTAGRLVFKGGVTTPSPSDSFSGIFSGAPSGIGMCSRTGATVDSGFNSFAEVQIGDTGRFGFATSVRLPGGSSASGIFEGLCGSPNTLAISGDIVPSHVGLPPGTTLQSPRGPSFGQPGHCAFITGLGGPGVIDSANSAIMMRDPSGMNMIARKGDQVPGLPPGVVYADFTTGSLRGPLMSLSGHVAFLCSVTGGGSNSDNNRVLLVRRPDGVFRTIVRLGDTPATYSLPTTILGFGNGEFAINASGETVVELGLFNAPPSRGGTVFLKSDAAGETSILHEAGTTHTVRPGLDVRVLSSTTGPQLSNGHDGRPKNWNDAGQFAFRAGYALAANPNANLGIGVFVVGGPRACSADFNQDGSLDPDDLADFIGAFFAVPPGAGSDFNGDGVTDPDDLADFIGAYFNGCP